MSCEESQSLWPFGPAPRRECAKASEHAWKIIDLAAMCEPPAPSFECTHCGYRWSRPWTALEFAAWLDRTNASASTREYYSVCAYANEPEYAPSSHPAT